jgi:hypothetical protein
MKSNCSVEAAMSAPPDQKGRLALVLDDDVDVDVMLKAPRAVPCTPGEQVTPNTLAATWSSLCTVTNVFEFYSHKNEKAGDSACFSNFFIQAPYEFIIPLDFCAMDLTEEQRSVECTFSEKAIMVCKAASMGDKDSFLAIAKSAEPKSCKALGRKVQNWNQAVWDKIVCSVAYHVVYQKFAKNDEIQKHLLATGNALMVEATVNDSNWGIGIDMGMPDVTIPSKWNGYNILGWALTEVRKTLRMDKGTS